MKNNCRRMCVVLCMVTLVCGMTGCSGEEKVEQTETQQETERIPSQEIVEDSEPTEDNIPQEENEIQDEIVDYGDRITISCDITEQPIVWEDAGEAVFQVATTSEQFQNEFDLSEETTMKKVEEAIGKTAGESFALWMEGGDGLYGYEYIIQEIVDKPADKAVEYGDTIKATVRRACILADDRKEISSQEDIELELLTPTGMINLAGNDLNMEDTMRFLKELQGKTIGDRMIFSTISDSQKRTYDITVLEITSGEPVEEYFDVEALMLSEEENSVYFYDDNETAPIYYAVVKDSENNIVREYTGGSGNSYFLEYRYGYEPEYDIQGRLIKETYTGGFEKICEYQYNDRDVCVKVVKSNPYADIVYIDYYDDAGLFIGSEELYRDGRKSVIEYADGSSICAKETEYDANGNVVTIWEYDEWGFLIEPEVN